MTRPLGVATCLALSLLSAPPALAADDDSSFTGECGFTTVNNVDQTTWDGAIYADVVVHSQTHGNVVNATVTCEVRVNDVLQASTSAHGSGLVVLADRLTFTADVVDVVELCTVVDYTSDDSATDVLCESSVTLQLIPQDVVDLFSYVVYVASSVLVTTDSYLCDALAQAAPGADPVTISGEGDVYLFGELFWDCPPDGSPMPDPPPFDPLPMYDPPSTLHGPSGGGYNTGSAGFLTLVSPASTTISAPPGEASDVASTCAYLTDPVTGATVVAGRTATARPVLADSARIRCRLEDTATGAVLYDDNASAAGPTAELHGVLAAVTGPVTVCTEGTGVWGTQETTVGLHCRPGEPL